MKADKNEPTPASADNRERAAAPVQPDIFQKLKNRGIEYERIIQIVTFSFPQHPFFFARQFGNRSIKEVLNHIEVCKRFLNREYLLSDELKTKAIQWIQRTEDMVWRTVQSVNPQVGDWMLHWEFTPMGIVETTDGERLPNMARFASIERWCGTKTCELVAVSQTSVQQ